VLRTKQHILFTSHTASSLQEVKKPGKRRKNLHARYQTTKKANRIQETNAHKLKTFQKANDE